MPCKMSCTSHGSALAYSLCGLPASSNVLRNMVTACNNFESLLLLLVLRLDKALLAPRTSYCVIASTSSVDGLSGACFSAQLIIIILLISDFPIPALSLQTLCLSTGNNTLSFFLSLFGYRVSFRSSPLLGASQPFTGFCYLRFLLASRSPSERFLEPVKSVQVFFPFALLSWVLSASLEAVPR